MTKQWKTLLAAVVLAGGLSSGAIADGYEPVGKGFAPPVARKWTGWHVGVHGGGTETNYSTSLNDGSEICWTQAQTTGAGAAEASCNISPTFAGASVRAVVLEEAGAGSAGGADTDFGGGDAAAAVVTATEVVGDADGGTDGPNVGPDTVSAGLVFDAENPGLGLSADGSGGAFANADPAIAAVAAHASASSPSGTADAVAVALVNAINLGTGGSIDNNSASVGGHVGYDHQFHNNIVIGFEADLTSLVDGDTTSTASDSFDFRTAGDAGSVTFATTTVSRSIGLDTKYIGTARARLGYAMGHILPYVTGGVAFAKFDIDMTTEIAHSVLDGTRTFSESQTRRFSEDAWGGVVGGGVAWMHSENVLLSAEGLYYKFDETVNVGPPPSFIFGDPKQRVELDDIVEGRIKLTIMLNPHH